MEVYYIPWVLSHTQLCPRWGLDYIHPRLLKADALETVDKDEVVKIYKEEKEENLKFEQSLIPILKGFAEGWQDTIQANLIDAYPEEMVIVTVDLPHAYKIDIQNPSIWQTKENPHFFMY